MTSNNENNPVPADEIRDGEDIENTPVPAEEPTEQADSVTDPAPETEENDNAPAPAEDSTEEAAPAAEDSESISVPAQEEAAPAKPVQTRAGKRIASLRAKRTKPEGKSKEALHAELKNRIDQLTHQSTEMSAKLKQMLSQEIEDYKKREKQRSAEILAVFAKHNFYANGFTPVELRTTLEDLGPTYVKIGQIMSSRVDLLPESYCRELEKLRQNVKQLDPEIARAVIEQETGKTIDEIYSEFRDKPLGSASIGQAHYGVLKDGTKVVTKVQRPLIAEMMRKDFVLLKKMAKAMGAVAGKGKDGEEMVDLESVITELEKVTEEELDFRIEAENTRFFKENCIDDETKINCPTVIDDLTTERIFTMTFVDGYSISKRDRLIADGYDPNAIGKVIIENYVHQILDVGTFHGDPHQGNIMVSHGVPYWIDFGMIGRITDADINAIQAMILSMIEGDMESLANAVMTLGKTTPQTDRVKLLEDIDAFMAKYMSVTSLSDLDMAVLMEQISDMAARNQISMPGKFTMLVRSLSAIEGVIEQLCPELNLFKIISDKLLERARKSFDVTQSLMSAGKDALEMGKKTAKVPYLAYDLLNNTVKGRTKINLELTGYEQLTKDVTGTVLNAVLALFSCVLFIGSCLLAGTDIKPQLDSGMPLISSAGLIFSFSLAIYTVRRFTKKK